MMKVHEPLSRSPKECCPWVGQNGYIKSYLKYLKVSEVQKCVVCDRGDRNELLTKHPDKESIDNLVKCVEIRSEHKEIIGN